MAVPIFTYGPKILTITRKQEEKVETAEIKFLRSIAGYTRKDQIRNTKIKEELNIFYPSNTILKCRLTSKYHDLRMEDRRIQKKMLTYYNQLSCGLVIKINLINMLQAWHM
jgi:hypothetical protein